MHREREYFYLLLLFTLATCFLPSLAADTEARVLMNFKSFLSNAGALNNWVNDSDSNISVCSWTGLICVNQTLHGLRLENMGLSGTINVDILLELPTLKSFSVINNSFEGPMPEFKKLVGLRALFLSKNKFSGEIGGDAFEGLRRLKRVFLAENGFTGHIPTSLAQLPRLLDVDLRGNGFGGNIPEFQQRDFRVFNLSYNQLEGPVQESLSNQDPSSFAGFFFLPIDRLSFYLFLLITRNSEQISKLIVEFELFLTTLPKPNLFPLILIFQVIRKSNDIF